DNSDGWALLVNLTAGMSEGASARLREVEDAVLSRVAAGKSVKRVREVGDAMVSRVAVSKAQLARSAPPLLHSAATAAPWWTRTGGAGKGARITIGYLGARHDDSPMGRALRAVLGAHAARGSPANAVLLSLGAPRPGDETAEDLRDSADVTLELHALDASARAAAVNRAHVHLIIAQDAQHPGVLALLALAPAPLQAAFLHASGGFPGERIAGGGGYHLLSGMVSDRVVSPPEFALDFPDALWLMPFRPWIS
ncbi:hypothetical protein T484DRAFT_1815346, partial [Baffinella frigidus]